MTDKLSPENAQTLIDRMHKRFGEGGTSVHEIDRLRLQNYYMEKSADPQVIQGWEGHARQWTGLRDTQVKLGARLNANPILPEVSAPRPSSNLEKQASDNELALLTMLEEMEEGDGVSLASLAAFGMGTASGAVLHWYLNDSAYNDMEELDYEEVDELPEDTREHKRYVEDDYGEIEGTRREKTKKYRETDESLMGRRAEQRAMRGSPWCAEILESTKFAYIENPKPLRRQFGLYKYGLKVVSLDLLDWFEGAVDVHSVARPVDVLPGGTEDTWRPSAQDEGKKVTFYQLWSREYVYEWVKGLPEEGKQKEFRCFPNRMKFVPFAFIAANITLSDDPALKHEPALLSLYRKKPEYDRYISNRGILAEAGAIPRYILQPLDDALPPLTNEDGHIKVLTGNALEGFKVPEGYRLERIGGDGAGADYVRYGEELRVEIMEAMPGTGHAEIESSTKPWTGRMMLTEANIFPSMCLDHMLAAWRIMIRNIAEVNGSEEGPGDICFYPKTEGKKSDSLIVIKPEQWKGLRYDVSVNKTSAVEQVTKMEHGRELLNDPLVGLTRVEFIREYEGLPNAEEVDAMRTATKLAEPVVVNMAKMKMTQWAGSQYGLTADMRIADATNRIVQPGQALASAGIPATPMPQQPQGQPIPPGGGGGMGNPQVRFPSLPEQPAQNGVPQQAGLVG